jgi:hypothetical protein
MIMLLRNNVTIGLAIVFGLCLQEIDAIRGIHEAGRDNAGTIAGRNGRRRATQWKGVIDPSHAREIPKVRGEDLPEEDEEVLEEVPSQQNIAPSTSGAKKASNAKASKGMKAGKKGEKGESESDCDDPSDPGCGDSECDDPSDPKCTDEVKTLEEGRK